LLAICSDLRRENLGAHERERCEENRGNGATAVLLNAV
jgi:hypothetical protein